MDDYLFYQKIKPLNKKYFELFGCIPSIHDYSCSRVEFVRSLEQAVTERKSIDCYLIKYKPPTQWNGDNNGGEDKCLKL